jgi:tripartite-type tricarboxylate transporter receptor subunit TctC
VGSIGGHGIASAQSYPTRPVRIIVTTAPGSVADIHARLLGQWLSERLGQSFPAKAGTQGHMQ